MTTTDRLERLEKAVGVLIGGALGGGSGARLGASAIRLHQMSPLHELELLGLEYLEGRARLARGTSGGPDRLFDSVENRNMIASPKPKEKRAATAYNKRYSKCFKKLERKYKKKNGGWKKDGFARCSRAARKCAK